MDLSLVNVINISVSESGAGAGVYNTSNVAIFTDETPTGSFGSAGYAIYVSPTQVGIDFGTSSNTYQMALALFSQRPNILANGGTLVVIPKLVSETLAAAITRTQDLVQYFGVISTKVETQTDMLAAAAVVQTLNKIALFGSRTAADIDPGGKLDQLRTNSYDQSRGLFYGGSTDLSVLQYVAAYAGRAFSTVFSGSNTTQTMHLKDLVGISADPSMTQTLLGKAQAAGADVFVSLQGIAKVFTSGTNQFFDHVYNTQWFVGALRVAGFNVLAQVSTKIAQTETGMAVLKGAYRQICEAAVRNGYLAPGKWTSPTTFGDQSDLVSNVGQRGYYIYSLPVSQQLQSDRDARKAPLCQIAAKEAGAMHSSSVIVNVNK